MQGPKKSAGNAPVNESRSAQPRVIDTVVVAPVANNETVINLRDSSKNTGNVIVAMIMPPAAIVQKFHWVMVQKTVVRLL